MVRVISNRVLPLVFLIISLLWLTAVVSPLIYSLLFPTKDIQQIVRALEGRESVREELTPLIQHVSNAAGRMDHAIPVGAYWHTSMEYNAKQSHRTKETELSYLAWFQKRSKPIILVITRSETDGSQLSFDIDEGSLFGIVRAYLLPALVLTFSVIWFRKRRTFLRDDSALPGTQPR